MPCPRIACDIAFGHISQRPDHDMPSVLGLQLRRHRLETPAVKQVQEKRLDNVIAVMTERYLGDAVLGRIAIQRAAAHA